MTAASINPSDVINVAGRFPATTLPRIPGRDYAGIVKAGPSEWIGKRVWGSGGDTGFTRDGTHAEYLEVPVASLSQTPSTLTDPEAASVGVTFLAAWCGVVEYARLTAGETLAVIGAAGGVGSAGLQIGRSMGAKVFGIDRGPGNSIIVSTPENTAAAQIRELTQGRGVDVVLNAVGGPMFRRRFENASASRPNGDPRLSGAMASAIRYTGFLSQRKPIVWSRYVKAGFDRLVGNLKPASPRF